MEVGAGKTYILNTNMPLSGKLFYGYRGDVETEKRRHCHQEAMEGTYRKGRGGGRKKEAAQEGAVDARGCTGQEALVREWSCEPEGGVAMGINCKVLNLCCKEVDDLERAGGSVWTPICLALGSWI